MYGHQGEAWMATQLKFSNLPDSELCVAAIDYARNVSEPPLFHHVMRSAVFADAIGRQRKMKFDPEVLCVAAVLHDLGLTRLAAVQARFELEGADAAKEFLVKRGMSEKDIETVWEAIALHTTAEIPSRRSPEVALCQMGIATDLFALPPNLMTAEQLDEVLEAYPWLGLDEALPSTLVGLFRKNPKAASSNAVTDACELHLPDFRKFNFCEHIVRKTTQTMGSLMKISSNGVQPKLVQTNEV
jgi:hypothetical protein